jgi:cell division septum initiation protein DivIVA
VKTNLEKLKKDIDSLITNLKIYERELNRFLKELKDEYGIEPDEVEEFLENIDKEIEKKKKKKKKKERETKELIRDIENALS